MPSDHIIGKSRKSRRVLLAQEITKDLKLIVARGQGQQPKIGMSNPQLATTTKLIIALID